MPDSTNFAPRSFFFTDPAAISQSEAQAFGPVDENQFRTTAKFSVSADTPAYAVCKGVVLVQPQATDSNRVNLILRPFKQPIQGLNIQYFVYRGLDVTDFFSNGDVLPAAETSSGFINSINAAFKAYYNHISPGAALPEFKASFIGYDPEHQPATTLLSDLFFKRSAVTGEGVNTQEESSFELPLVDEGTSLGNFKAGECGFEVVLSYGDYKLPEPNDEFRFDLAYARTNENTINVSAETDEFKKKRIREQIIQFLDTAAYYGFHYREDGQVTVKSNIGNVVKKSEQIYNDVIANFHTKNNLYIYIQSDRGRSYNFYGNYNIDDTGDNSLKAGVMENTLTAIPYHTNEWPLLIEQAPQQHDDTQNKLFLQLVTDNNVNTMFYGRVAHVDNAQGNNFCNAEYLQLPLRQDGTSENFTKVLQLSNPALSSGADKLYVANFNLLIYQGKRYYFLAGQRRDDEGSSMNTYRQSNMLDDLFSVTNALPLPEADIKNASSYHVSVFQYLGLVNHYFDERQYGITASQTCLINDKVQTDSGLLDRVGYHTETLDLFTDVTSNLGKTTIEKSSSSTQVGPLNEKTYRLNDSFYYDLIHFTDLSSPIVGMVLRSVDNAISTKVIVGLTDAEHKELANLVDLNLLTNSRLVLINPFNDDNLLTSVENITYLKFNAGVVGETATGELRLYSPESEVVIYTLDRRYHFSKGYSDFAPEQPLMSLFIDFDISL